MAEMGPSQDDIARDAVEMDPAGKQKVSRRVCPKSRNEPPISGAGRFLPVQVIATMPLYGTLSCQPPKRRRDRAFVCLRRQAFLSRLRGGSGRR